MSIIRMKGYHTSIDSSFLSIIWNFKMNLFRFYDSNKGLVLNLSHYGEINCFKTYLCWSVCNDIFMMFPMLKLY